MFFNSTSLTKRTFKLAYELSNPNPGFIFHSDNGANYISRSFTSYIKQFGAIISYSKKHNPYNNSVCESFFSILKTEELYHTNYKSNKGVIKSISNFISFYNSERPHSYLRYTSPQKFENKYYLNHSIELNKMVRK